MENLLLTLRNLAQEAAAAPDARVRVRGIVSRVKSAMEVAVCSLYLADEAGVLTLVATEGLNPEAVGRIQLRPGEGLVGRIAATQHLLNVESASHDPHFRYFPESGEERYEAFLGVPVVHTGQLIGVLVVEQQARRKFTEEEESFLVTVAAQLGATDPAGFRSEPAGKGEGEAAATRRIKGIRGAPGVGIGRIVLLSDAAGLLTVADVQAEDIGAELRKFREAVEATLDDLAASQRKVAASVSGDVAEVFTIHRMLLQGEGFCGAIEEAIRSGKAAAAALRMVVLKLAARFEEAGDDYLRARSEDMHNLGSRVYDHMRHVAPVETAGAAAPVETAGVAGGERVVLVGGLVGISDIAAQPIDQLAGIVSMEGSALSHTAVLAKALGVPAVMGIGHVGDIPEEATIIVDGYQGQVLLAPSPPVIAEFRRLIEFDQSLVRELAKLRELPAQTPDGFRVHLLANTGLLADITPGLAHGAEGIGLYRTEIPFIVRGSFPSEDEQVDVYRTVLEAYKEMPVYLRTLDVGGDKPLPYYPFKEENPALGWRGVRFTLDNSAVFMTQIRAMLRAAADPGHLHIILPMVGSVPEVDAFSVLLDSALAQLAEEGIAAHRPRVGIMAEVPASIAVLPFLSGKIDFVSIGTNDLTQYLLAVDRNNPNVSSRFDHLHPAVLQAVDDILARAAALGIGVSVCGEMASDPCAAVILLGMGVDSLSMAACSIPRIKWLVRSVSRAEAQEQSALARRCPDSPGIRRQLQEFLKQRGLGVLLEPRQGAEHPVTSPLPDFRPVSRDLHRDSLPEVTPE